MRRRGKETMKSKRVLFLGVCYGTAEVIYILVWSFLASLALFPA